MSDEIIQINSTASTSSGFVPPQPERPINPVRFFRMTGGCPLPKSTDTFILGEQIGSGSFSHVYKAIDKRTETAIAVKSYRMKKKDLDHFSRAATEMAFIRFLRHPNIIGYILADIKKEYMYLAVDYSPYGSLAIYIIKNVGLPETAVRFIMKQLISALCYLHSMCICHGDVKPENIIVCNVQMSYITIKLTDFGLADVVLESQIPNKKAGSFYYMAPEIHLGFPSDYKSDLFSSGVVMYELIFAQKPFSAKLTKEIYIANFKKRIGHPPLLDVDYLSPDCKNLMKNLLSYDRQERLCGEELAKHPFLCIQLFKDDQSHYMKACECFVRGMEFVNKQEFGSGYIELTEAVLHLKIHMNRIKNDRNLYQYTLSKHQEYKKYCEAIEEHLICNKNCGSLSLATQSERLRCLLKSTPALLTGYDLCALGEMYMVQCNKVQGARMVKEGLEILFPLMGKEPEGLRKHVLANKIEQWVIMLENMESEQEGSGSDA